MRRGLRLPGLGLVLAVSLTGSGVAIAGEPGPLGIHGRSVTATRTGMIDVESAAAWDRRARALGLEAPPVPIHSPMPVPEMPVPKEWLPAEAPDQALATYTPQSPLPLPTPGPGFPALIDNQGAIPPDTHGAASSSWLMTTLNTQVVVQDRNGNVQPTWPVTLRGFWGTVSTAPTIPAYGNVFDPRVLYDPDPVYGGRWIWVAAQMPRRADSGILVAASSTSDPAGGPAGLFDVDASDSVWADYPTVGFNKHWVVVQVNLFGMTSPYLFVRSHVYVFRKDELYNGTLNVATEFSLESACEGMSSCGGTQVPALTYDTDQDDLYLLQRWNSGAGALRLYVIAGSVSAPTLTPLTPLATGPGWADSETTGPGSDFAPQPPACGGSRIQTNDSRIQNVVFRSGSLWATHTVFLPAGGPARASVQWWQIRPDSFVEQRGLVDSGTSARFYAFPSIAVNRNKDVLLGFSTFSDTDYASAAYTFRLGGDPPSTMEQPVVLRAGDTCYYKPAGGKNRWGDYSATVVDPFDDVGFWTIQEYAATPSSQDRWGTWWGNVEPPVISIADASVGEGDAATTPLIFTLTLSQKTSETVTVQWAASPGTATETDGDYAPAGGTAVFAPSATTTTVQVDVNGDLKHEPDEQLTVTLSSPQYATLGNAQATGTILNDDPLPQMSISDEEILEGTPPTTDFTYVNFKVRLSNPSSSIVSARWDTWDGAALRFLDYVPDGGTVTFDPGDVEKIVTVTILADGTGEPDEDFTVQLTELAGATPVKPIGTCIILNDDGGISTPPVSSLVVVSDGSATAGRNRLQWVNPRVAAQGIRITFTTVGCPATPGDGTAIDVSFWGAGTVEYYEHQGLGLYADHCYAVWVWYGGSTWSPLAAGMTATPFPATGKVKWKYFTGATSVAIPAVGHDLVVQPSNDDSLLHGITRGALGGMWPAPWSPYPLGSPAQARSPIVPLTGASLAFVSTQDGRIRAIDTATRLLRWSTLLPEGAVTAAPAGIFKPGGAYDYVLVGTSSGLSDHFYALDPYNGAVIDSFPGPYDGGVKLGAVLGMASVDYDTRRVYFTSREAEPGSPTVWCLELGPSSDALRMGWTRSLGPVDASPILRDTRVYVADDNTGNWAVWSIPADTGLGGYSLRVGTSAIRGFLFPDRAAADKALYGATVGEVVAIVDTSTALVQKWAPLGLSSPSIVVLEPGTNRLYAGVRSHSAQGASLVRINTATGQVEGSVELETQQQIVGPPSLDLGLSPNPNMIYVGSEKGVLYAVEASF